MTLISYFYRTTASLLVIFFTVLTISVVSQDLDDDSIIAGEDLVIDAITNGDVDAEPLPDLDAAPEPPAPAAADDRPAALGSAVGVRDGRATGKIADFSRMDSARFSGT